MIDKIYCMHPKLRMKGILRNTECCEISCTSHQAKQVKIIG